MYILKVVKARQSLQKVAVSRRCVGVACPKARSSKQTDKHLHCCPPDRMAQHALGYASIDGRDIHSMDAACTWRGMHAGLLPITPCSSFFTASCFLFQSICARTHCMRRLTQHFTRHLPILQASGECIMVLCSC